MKNFRKFAVSRAGIVSILSLGVVLFLISTTESGTKKANYDVLQSKITISGSLGAEKWTLQSNDINCAGNYEIKNGELLNISELSFSLPVKQLKCDNHQLESALQEIFKQNNFQEFVFKQEHFMVLPIMKMAHVIGRFNMVNGVNTLPLQLHYELNDEKQLRIWCKQSINLNQLGILVPEYQGERIDDEIEMDIDFVLLNKGI